jgi:hypothetical protein
MPNISLFGSIYDTTPKDDISLDAYLEAVQNGRWEDIVTNIRIHKTREERKPLKLATDRVTFSGTFTKREDKSLIEPSGYIAIDIDDLEDPESVKDLLANDRYVYAAFLSSSGTGLIVLFKIQPGKHREAFLGIAEYLLETYELVIDPNSINVSKPMTVTWDPNIYLSEKEVRLFTRYAKEKKVEKISNFAFAQNDFEKLIFDLVSRKINICEDYDRWLKVGFAFADKFAESGREYYHLVSGISEKYNENRVNRQYDYCLRNAKNLKIATISTFYYYCKDAGLQITSERTSRIRKATVNGKSAGLT